jgi:hypothetical protein
MKVIPLTKGDIEPVPLSELKQFCRLSSGDIEDASLRRMLRGARTQAEHFARIAISPRLWRSTFELPYYRQSGLKNTLVDEDGIIDFVKLRGPLISVEDVTLFSRMAERISPPLYGVFPQDNRIVWETPQAQTAAASGLDLITTRSDVMFDRDAFMLQVDYIAGYSPIALPNNAPEGAEKLCDAPDDIIEAICLMVADVYEHRGEQMAGDLRRAIPSRASRILKAYWTPAL